MLAFIVGFKTTTHLALANGNDVATVRVYLHIERGSEIPSQLVIRDACGDTL